MTLSRRSRLRSNPDHGPPVEVPTMGVPACSKCLRPYRWSSETGRRTKPPYGPCRGMKQSELERTSGLSPVSKSNSGREHQKDDAYREWIRELPCILQRSGAARCEGRIDPAHVKNWGAGWGDFIEIVEDGEAVRVGNIVPLCRKHHRLSENEPGWGPETFEKHYGIDLAGEARRLGERYRNHHEGGQNAGQD